MHWPERGWTHPWHSSSIGFIYISRLDLLLIGSYLVIAGSPLYIKYKMELLFCDAFRAPAHSSGMVRAVVMLMV